MSQLQRFEGLACLFIGLFIIIFLGGKLLLQLLGIVGGVMLCVRGYRLLFSSHGYHQRSFFTFFDQNRFF